MRRALPLLVTLVLVGCQGGESPKLAEPVVTKPAAPSVAPPYSTDPGGELAIFRQERAVRVGMTADAAFKVFNTLSERGLEGEQLPPGFVAPYHATWYEVAQEGFGVITYKEQIALAMYQADHLTVDAATEVTQAYIRRYGEADKHSEARGVTYWFWERDHQRLMICAVNTSTEGVSITCCVGDTVPMDALHASPTNPSIPTPIPS